MRRFLIAAALAFVTLPLLATGVPVAPGIVGPASGPRSSPAVAAGPDQLLAVWYDGTRVVATRLRTDGSPIDALPIVIGERGREGGWRDITVAWNGSNYRIVWRRERHELSELATAAVNTDGTIFEAERQFSSDGASPSIAWNGVRHKRRHHRSSRSATIRGGRFLWCRRARRSSTSSRLRTREASCSSRSS